MNYKSVHYVMIDENGDRSSDALITADNMFYIMGSTWNFKLADCLEKGYAPVLDSDRQFINGEGTMEVALGDMIKNADGTFTQLWIDGEIPLEEKRARFMERTRLNLLSQSDWTQVVDSPLSDELKAEYKVYRQALRDLPNSINWETIQSETEISWPKQPGVVEPTPEEAAAINPNIPRDPETGEPL
jgi:hypothetical protein